MKKIIVAVMVLVLSLSFMNLTAMADININWEKETDMPTAVNNTAIGVVGSKIYVIGGRSSENGDNLNKVEVYDTVTKTWTTGAPMPTARYGAAYAAINGKIYVVGGVSYDGTKHTFYNTLEIYDVDTNTWSTGTRKPTASVYSNCTVINGKIYTFGGYNQSTNNTNVYLNSFEIYDPATNSWIKETPIPNGYANIKPILYNGKIYLFGGRSTDVTYNNNVDIYDIATKKWTNGATMPYNVSFGTAQLIDGSVYYMGGRSGVEDSTIKDSISIYDISKNEWTMSTTTLRGGPRTGLVSAIVNGRLYIIGGNMGNGIFTNTVYSFPIDEKLFVYLNTGEELQLSMDYNLSENANYTWSSSDPSIATVDTNGKVTAVAEGTTYVYCESSDGMFRDYVPVKVSSDASEKRLAVHLTAGESKRLWITDDTSAVTWFSNDTSVAVVDSNGNVTGVSKGLCLVQGTINNKTYNIYVRVL